jgi:hypothetical protein
MILDPGNAIALKSIHFSSLHLLLNMVEELEWVLLLEVVGAGYGVLSLERLGDLVELSLLIEQESPLPQGGVRSHKLRLSGENE